MNSADIYTGNRVARNAIMAVIQVIVSGSVLFLLYRYLLRTIGSEQVGIWALVLATASASRIAEMGFGGSAVKYTAKYIARAEKNKASEVIQTTAITIGFFLAFVLATGYPLIAWLIGKIVPDAHIASALEILPYALISVWIGAIAGVFASGLDGCQRIDLRVLVSILATAFLLVLTWLLVPGHGLVGLAWAQVGQGILLLLVSWILLRRELPTLPIFFFKWRITLFREMFQYGFNFQVISIFGMLFDPTTKALMAKFGGLSSTAFYEMASRMVMQFRLLLVSANQVVVPQVADLHENAPEEIQKKYLDSYRVIFFLSLPLYAGVAAVAPLAGELWIGHYERRFIGYTLLLLAGYWTNTLIGPAYFFNLGTGLLRWNTWSHVIIGGLNVLFGYCLGMVLGGGGVVLGYVLALVIGSSVVVLAYHRDSSISLMELFPRESIGLFFACCVGIMLGPVIFHFSENPKDALAKAGMSLAICTIVIAPVFWKHPLRKKIVDQFSASFGKRA